MTSDLTYYEAPETPERPGLPLRYELLLRALLAYARHPRRAADILGVSEETVIAARNGEALWDDIVLTITTALDRWEGIDGD